MSNPSDNATFARTIKLLVANLDKTKERIQERFLQVDERLDEIEKLISSLQQNARPKSDDSTNILENQISDLSQKIAVMESQIKDLENSQKIVAPAPPASVVSESAKTTAPISATIPAAMAVPVRAQAESSLLSQVGKEGYSMVPVQVQEQENLKF